MLKPNNRFMQTTRTMTSGSNSSGSGHVVDSAYSSYVVPNGSGAAAPPLPAWATSMNPPTTATPLATPSDSAAFRPLTSPQENGGSLGAWSCSSPTQLRAPKWKVDLGAWKSITSKKDPLLLALNFNCAVALIFVNKLVFTQALFHYTTALSLIHYVITWLILVLLRSFGVFHPQAKPLTRTFWLLCAVLGMDTPLNNLSLKLNSIGVYQIVKLLVTPVIVAMEYMMYGKRISAARGLYLTLVSVGVGIATVSDVQFSTLGAAVAMAWVAVSAAKKVLWAAAEHTEGWSTLPLMHRSYPVAMLWAALSWPLLDPPGLLSYALTPARAALLLASGVGAFFVSWSAFKVVGSCSPITHVLLGQVKSVVAMLGGYFFFGQYYPLMSIVGCSLAMAGVFLYTNANLMEQSQQQQQQQQSQRHKKQQQQPSSSGDLAELVVSAASDGPRLV